MITIRNTVLSSLIGSALMCLSLATHAFELTHSTGTLHRDTPPQKIVSYEIAHIDTLNALGIEVAGVPKSTYKDELSKFNDLPVVGTLFEPDFAALKELQPDLIIAGGRSANAIEALNILAPTVSFQTDPNNFLASVKQSTLQLAHAFEVTEQAQEKLAQLEQQVQELHQLNHGKTGALLFTINGRLIPHAPGDRFGYVYELSGLQSILPKRTAHELNQPRPEPGSAEAHAAAAKIANELNTIAKADPDWIIMLDRGAINDGEKTAATTLAAHDALRQTRAFKEGRIYYAEPNRWYLITGGLNNLTQSTADMLEHMRP